MTRCTLAGGLLPSSSSDVSVKFRFLVVRVFFIDISLGCSVGASNPKEAKSSRFYCRLVRINNFVLTKDQYAYFFNILFPLLLIFGDHLYSAITKGN